MKLSQISIQRPVLATMMSLALVVFGLISLTRLPVRELPDIDPPIVSVTTVYPGANAAVIETEITERLEEAVNNIEGIKTLTSQSRDQVSTVTIEFDLSRHIELAAQDVRDRVSRVRGRLPDSINEPMVAKQDADARPVMWIGLHSETTTPLQLTQLAEKRIKNRLQTVAGVSSIIIGGEQRKAVRLWLDSERMAAHQVTVLDIERALRQQNVQLPSGRIEGVDRELSIETSAQLFTPDDFNAMVLRVEGIKVVRFRDVGEARLGVENERTVARVRGEPCIFLGVVKQSKANTVQVADGIKAELEQIRPTLDPSISMVINYDESIYVKSAIEEVWISLGIAFLLVVVVVFLFLGDLRSTLIPTVAIPVSIIATFMLLQGFGYSINILTMLALVLAIGVVVDDAIVVLENIHRHIENGLSPMEAARKAMDEIGFAIIAITLSLVAVFLPLAFQTSSTGQLFIEFAVAVAGSVVISAFVALSLTPMMAARILRPISQERRSALVRFFDKGMERLVTLYRATLVGALNHRGVVVLLGIGSLALMVVLYNSLEKEFLPEEDKGRILSFVSTPQGSTTEYTDRMLRKVEGMLKEMPEVASYGAIVAPGFAGPGEVNSGIVFVRLSDDRERSVQEIVNGPTGLRARLFNEVEGGIAIAQIPKAIDRSFSSAFQLVIRGDDLGELDRVTTALSAKLRQLGFLQNVRASFEFNKPELHLEIDRNRAAVLGVSIEDISKTMQILFGGLDLSKIKEDGKEYDVIAQLARPARQTPSDLDRVYVRSAAGSMVSLNNLVRWNERSAPNRIEHYNRLRSTTLSASIVGMPLGTAIDQVNAILAQDLPPGFSHEWAGESRDLTEAGTEVLFILILALIIVYMVLAAQFESLIHPFTVMLAVPLAAVGAFGLLWVMAFLGKSGWMTALPAMNINLFSQIGLILLVGLVTKNSILLVEFANQRMAEGLGAREAMIEAGVVRLRPILMTAFSTVAGILPIAIGFGAGAESRRPMGMAIVGGMLTSTFLTLLIIPVIYTLLDGLSKRLRRVRH